MSRQNLEIRELAAWGYDLRPDRGSLTSAELEDAARAARREVEARKPYAVASPISEETCGISSGALARRCKPVADSGEFEGLQWHLAVVDLRRLIAFQRRVGFAEEDRCRRRRIAGGEDLLDLALPATQAQPAYQYSVTPDRKSLALCTLSPNLRVCFAPQADGGIES
ncbi:MAG: hypothetical protein ACP5FH_07035, partial [Terracidiphilus sp.]